MRWKEIKDKIKAPCFPGMHLEKEQELMALAKFIRHLHHNRSLFGGKHQYIYHQVRDFHDAEDLTIQAFLEAWKALPRYQEKGVFTAWLRYSKILSRDSMIYITYELQPKRQGATHFGSASHLNGKLLITRRILC